MKPIASKLLIALTSAGVAASLGWLFVLGPGAVERMNQFVERVEIQISDWTGDQNEIVGGGMEVCARCGALREVKLKRRGRQEFVARDSKEQAWAEARIGACKEHAWQVSGCWEERNRVGSTDTCTMLADEHSMWRALAQLGGEHANRLAHRFANLTSERQLELWRNSNRHQSEDFSPKQIARAVSSEAGWSDLAEFWSD